MWDELLDNAKIIQGMLWVMIATPLPAQLLLCLKGRRLLVRLLPALLLLGLLAACVAAVLLTPDEWGKLVYALLAVLFGIMLCMCGVAWGIWAVVAALQKRRKAR